MSRRELAFLTSCSISSCVSLSAAGLGCGLEGERLVMSFSGSGDLLLLNKRRMTVELLVAFGDLLATSPSVSELEISPKRSSLSSPTVSATVVLPLAMVTIKYLALALVRTGAS